MHIERNQSNKLSSRTSTTSGVEMSSCAIFFTSRRTKCGSFRHWATCKQEMWSFLNSWVHNFSEGKQVWCMTLHMIAQKSYQSGAWQIMHSPLWRNFWKHKFSQTHTWYICSCNTKPASSENKCKSIYSIRPSWPLHSWWTICHQKKRASNYCNTSKIMLANVWDWLKKSTSGRAHH